MAQKALITSGRSLAFNMFKVTCAVITETLEELYVDPMIEAYVTNKVADMGWNEVTQILLSGLAESGREQFLSSVTSFARAGFGGRTQIDTNIQPSATNIENTIESNLENARVAQEAKAQQQLRQEYIKEGLSTILMFAGAIAGGFGGSIGTALGNVMMVAGTSVEGIDSIKDMFEAVLKKEHVQTHDVAYGLDTQLRAIGLEKLNDLVYNEISTLDEAQIPHLKDGLVDEMVELASITTPNILMDNIMGFNNFKLSPDHDYSTSDTTGNVLGAHGLNPNQINRINNLVTRLINYLEAHIIKAKTKAITGSDYFFGRSGLSEQKVSLNLGMHKDWIGMLRRGRHKYVKINSIVTITSNIVTGRLNQILPKFIKANAIRYFTEPMLDIWFNKRYSEEVDKPKRVELVDKIIQELQKLLKMPLSDDLASEILYTGHSKTPAFFFRNYKAGTTRILRDEFQFTTLFKFIYYSATLQFKVVQPIVKRETGKSIWIESKEFNAFRSSITRIIMDHILKYGFTIRIQKQDVLIDNIDSDLLNLIISASFAFASDNNREVVSIWEKAPQIIEDLRKGVTPSQAVFSDLKLKIKKLTSKFASRSKQDAISKIDDFISKIGNYRKQDIGTLAHVSLAEIFIRSIVDRGYKAFYEVLSRSFNPDIKEGYRVDSIISRTPEFSRNFEAKVRLESLRRDPNVFIPVFNSKIKYITIDYTMSTDLEVIKEKLDKGYYGKDTHLLIVLYNKDRASLARSWDRQIQGFITDYPGHVNVITIEDLSRFLDLDKASNEELNSLMYSKRLALSGNEDNFNNLKEQRDSKLISLHQMKVTQYWFDKYIGSK